MLLGGWLPQGLSRSRTSASGGVWMRHCSVALRKQVLSWLTRPAPCSSQQCHVHVQASRVCAGEEHGLTGPCTEVHSRLSLSRGLARSLLGCLAGCAAGSSTGLAGTAPCMQASAQVPGLSRQLSGGNSEAWKRTWTLGLR